MANELWDLARMGALAAGKILGQCAPQRASHASGVTRARCGGARELLAPVYGWFTEGFDTRDLKTRSCSKC